MSLLQLHEICKSYGRGRAKVSVLHDITSTFTQVSSWQLSVTRELANRRSWPC